MAHLVCEGLASWRHAVIVFQNMGDDRARVEAGDMDAQLAEVRRELDILWAVVARAQLSSGRLGLDELDTVLADRDPAMIRLRDAVPCARRPRPPLATP